MRPTAQCLSSEHRCWEWRCTQSAWLSKTSADTDSYVRLPFRRTAAVGVSPPRLFTHPTGRDGDGRHMQECQTYTHTQSTWAFLTKATCRSRSGTSGWRWNDRRVRKGTGLNQTSVTNCIGGRVREVRQKKGSADRGKHENKRFERKDRSRREAQPEEGGRDAGQEIERWRE